MEGVGSLSGFVRWDGDQGGLWSAWCAVNAWSRKRK